MKNRNAYIIHITSQGTINGEPFTARGEGSGDPAKGNPDVRLEYSRIPNGSHPFGNFLAIINMLSLLLSRRVGKAESLLSLAGGNFTFARQVVGQNVDVSSKGAMRCAGGREVYLESEIEGTVRLPKIVSIRPWQAMMIPGGEDRILETMIVPLRAARKSIPMYVTSEYTFDRSIVLPATQVRSVFLKPSAKGNTFVGQFDAAVSLPQEISNPLGGL